MSDKTVQRIEDGDRVPDLTQVRRLAAVFGLTTSGLLARAERRIVEERHASTAVAYGVPSAAREQMADLELHMMTEDAEPATGDEPDADQDEEPEQAPTRQQPGRAVTGSLPKGCAGLSVTTATLSCIS